MAGFERYRNWIRVKLLDNAQSVGRPAPMRNAPMGGEELVAVVAQLKKIGEKDPELATRLEGFVKILPKYAALEVIAEKAERFQPELEAIFEASLKLEMQAAGK